ncbi:MAG: ParB/RepB/Spo0J family partition protein [Lachnospiraceae bacterium]|nr:ParB/RepB/Spo0J family partition protein [Lachnospiraceae bacterium]
MAGKSKKSGLGKGLETLIPVGEMEEIDNLIVKEKKTEKNSGDTVLKISQIEPNKSQPRKNFNEDSLQELADSIKQFGIIQPLVVQKKDKYYEIIAGERRWRAARIAGLKEVPVIIKDYSEQEVVEIALIENIQREDLNPIEEAQAYKRLLEEYNLKQDEVAERVSKSRTAVTNSMRLLKLSDKVQEMLIDEMITSGHARAILAIEDEELQYEIAERVMDEKLSVRETEKLVKAINNPKKKKDKVEINRAVYDELEVKIKDAIGNNVKLSPKANGKGKIEIEYYSTDDLERITDILTKMQ